MADIILVEDDFTLSNTLARLLQKVGYSVRVANNGKQALEEYRKKWADAVVTDIIMPEIDGLELIRDLRKENPEVKIIAISGGAETVPQLAALRSATSMGAMHVLSKPVDIEELITALKNLRVV